MPPNTPSELKYLDDAIEDINSLGPDEGSRVFNKIDDWGEKIKWGRSPRRKLTYLDGSPPEYNFYRQWVGRNKFRVIYEISGDRMLVVAVIRKDDHAYDMRDYVRRMKRYVTGED